MSPEPIPPYLAPLATDPARWAAVVALARRFADVPEDRALAWLHAVWLLAPDLETSQRIDAVGFCILHPEHLT